MINKPLQNLILLNIYLKNNEKLLSFLILQDVLWYHKTKNQIVKLQ